MSVQRWALGLRPRLLAALVLTAAVTLAVAALALLSPLEQRLRNDGEARTLAAVAAARGHFAQLPLNHATGLPDHDRLLRQVFALRKATGSSISVYDSRLRLISAPPGSPHYSSADATDAYGATDQIGDVREALATGVENHDLNDDVFNVAEPVRIGGRLFAVVLRRRLSYVSSSVATVRHAFLEAALVGLAVALLLGIGLSSRLVRRLARLRETARELEHGGLDAREPTDKGRDEIADLARAFAGMQRQLRRQEAARRSFVATASHELRTPLASLEGMLELLEDDLAAENLDLDDARERTTMAREQARRLSQLASDLLDLSRLDADLELRTEPLELVELCRAVAAEFDLRADEAAVRLAVDQPADSCWIAADPGAVARIVRILLDNALRVAPRDSHVDVRIAHTPGWATATVADEGPGVPDDERELIFERFQRGSAAGPRSGFGLGLAIGRELADRMGGSLELERTPGRGARFTLRLPLAAVSEQSPVRA